jgi:hypothetical protein
MSIGHRAPGAQQAVRRRSQCLRLAAVDGKLHLDLLLATMERPESQVLDSLDAVLAAHLLASFRCKTRVAGRIR